MNFHIYPYKRLKKWSKLSKRKRCMQFYWHILKAYVLVWGFHFMQPELFYEFNTDFNN